MHIIRSGCEIGYLSLREDHRLRVFENRALKRILGLRRKKQKDEEEGNEVKCRTHEEGENFSSEARKVEGM
jgi:hypothetical protein